MKDARIQPVTIVQRVEGPSVTVTAEGMFLMDIRVGYLFKLNQTAGSIWEILRDPISVRQLSDRLAMQYGIGNPHFDEEIAGLLDSLRDAGLIRIRNVEAHGTVG